MINKDALTDDPFTWEKARAMAVASELSYRSETTVRRVATQLWGFDDIRVLDEGDTQGFVCWDESSVLVAFRGTESIGDWLGNLKVTKVERTYGKLHKGFFEGFRRIEHPLEQALVAAEAEGKTIHVTGHSLGGALAATMVAEIGGVLPIGALYTYGQPKLFNAAALEHIEHLVDSRYYRFVNDRDLVARVPPGYRHGGKLIWFDASGQLRRFDAEGSGAGQESIAWAEKMPASTVAELDEQAFEQLQEQIKGLTRVASESKSSAGESLQPSLEGLIPGLNDHAISEYVRLVRRMIRKSEKISSSLAQTALSRFGASSKWAESWVSSKVEQAAAEGIETGGTEESMTQAVGMDSLVGSGTSGEMSIPVLLRLRDPDWQAPVGLYIQSRLGTVVSASVSEDQLEALQADSGVASIDASRDGGGYELDESLPFVRAVDVQRPPIDERGDAALIGVIDTGVDVLHNAFRDADDQSVIDFLWDQRDPFGPSPNSLLPGVFDANYGRLYLPAEIQAMIEGQEPVPGPLRDPLGHGTHVASIAAGRPAGEFAGGVAPEARIVTVIPAMRTAPGDAPSIGYSNSHFDSLGFMRSAAEHLQKPIAVNVSLGMNAGAHDGSSLLEAGFDGFSTNGRDPGLILIKSAGNERGHGGHARVDVAENVVSEIVWDSSDEMRDEDYIELWFEEFNTIDFNIQDPAGNTLPFEVSVAQPKFAGPLGVNSVHLDLEMNHADNGDNLLVLRIQRDQAPIQPGLWRLQLIGRDVVEDCMIDAWVERSVTRAVTFQTGDNDEMTLSIPGTAKYVVSVGACASEAPIRLTSSSSWGRTRDKREKPELCAPGEGIRAAAAGTNDNSATVAKTGTSMAAPHVAGAVALVLSKCTKAGGTVPNLNQVSTALKHTTKNFTGTYHRGVGFGVLDVLEFYQRF